MKYLPFSLASCTQATVSVCVYSLTFLVCALALLRPSANVSLVPSTGEGLFAVVVKYGVAFLALGAILTIVTLAAFQREAKHTSDIKRAAVRSILTVAAIMLVGHCLVASNQTLGVLVPVSNDGATTETIGNSSDELQYLSSYHPLQQVARLSAHGIMFGLFGTVFRCSHTFASCLHTVLWVLYSLVAVTWCLPAHTDTFKGLAAVLVLLFVVMLVLLVRMRRIILSRLTQVQAQGGNPKLVGPEYHRPGVFLAKYLIPLFILIICGYAAARIVTLQSALPAITCDILGCFLDIISLVLVGMIVSDVIWQEGKAQEAESLAEHQKAFKAETEIIAHRTFLRYICHELRVPLNGIMLATEELLGSPAVVSQCTEDVGTIKTAAVSMTKLLDDFLTLARIDAGMLQFSRAAYCPATLAAGALSMLRTQYQAKSITCALSVAEQVPEIAMGDTDRLRQVLTNFLSNAINFTPSGGNITVNVTFSPPVSARLRATSTPNSKARGKARLSKGWSPHSLQSKMYSHQDTTAVTTHAVTADIAVDTSLPMDICLTPGADSSVTFPSARTSRPQGASEGGNFYTRDNAGNTGNADASAMLKFTVVDTGCGIAKDDIEKLFRPFEQIQAGVEQKGNDTGLGLAICKRIIDAYGGEIGCESVEGAGSTFWFTVPLDISRSAVSPTRSVDASAAATGLNTQLEGSTIEYSRPSTKANALTIQQRAFFGQQNSRERSRLSVASSVGSRQLVLAAGASDQRLNLNVPDESANTPTQFIRNNNQHNNNNDEDSPVKATVLDFAVRPLHNTRSVSSLNTAPSNNSMLSSAPPPANLAPLPIMAQETAPNTRTPIPQAPAPELNVITCAASPIAEAPTDITTSLVALVVDDTASNRLLLARKLKRFGFDAVYQAVDGVDALEKWPVWFPSSLPNVCFVDHNMPRMNGEELTLRLRAECAYTGPIIGVTGDALEEDRHAFMQSGLDGIILKPYTNERLHEELLRFGMHLNSTNTSSV
jgi:signal transduction histidine kinase/CheY-like chemotaxis protein